MNTEEEARRAKEKDSLPWESSDESKSIISESLMSDILQLAMSENNFTESPPTKIIECCKFDFHNYVGQAMKLLSLDQNLARVHAKVSPKMNEEIFWRNYFTRIYFLRCKSGILGNDDPIVQTVASFDENDVIFKVDSANEDKIPPKSKPVTDNIKSDRCDTATTSVTNLSSGGKKTGWENSSSEDVSGNESALSTSSYEVLHVTGRSGKTMTAISDESLNDIDEDALFEAQVYHVHISEDF